MSTLLLVSILGAAILVARMVFKNRPTMSPSEAAAAVEKGNAVLVDVREPAEWTRGVAQVAALLPLSDLRGNREKWTPFLEENRGRRILVYCQSGARSGLASSILKGEGFDTANVGAFSDWRAGGLPVRTP
jgi:rhodanese-related sulfurtransferase